MKKVIYLLFVLSFFSPSLFLQPAWGKSIPETNALISEVKITPPASWNDANIGRLVAARSNLFVVGFWNEPPAGANSPLAGIYSRTNGGFELVQPLQVPGLTNFMIYDLATDGTRVAISGQENYPTNTNSIVYIFNHLNGTWSLQNQIVIPSSITSLGISGDLLVCGAPFSALVFEFSNGEWQQKDVLRPPENTPNVVKNGFGADVAIHNSTIVVGARGEIRTDAGRAYAFVKGAQGWRLEAEFLPEPFTFIPFGSVVAIEGDTSLVSAFISRFSSGMVYVFQRSSGVWRRKGILQGETQDFFGQSLALSGRNIVVGAPSAMNGSGAVYLFRDAGSHFEAIRMYREDLDNEPSDFLGYAVAVDGNTVIAGAPFHDGYGENRGVVFAFEFQFRPWLHSPWARTSDHSFHFALADAQPGKPYAVEYSTGIGNPWMPLYPFIPTRPDWDLHTDMNVEGNGTFFRVVEK